jgi:16S rRNA (guanine527-N7)-methyltransferase
MKDEGEPTDDDLRGVLDRYGVELEEDQIEQLRRYCQALWDWNSKLNLTRHTTYEKIVARDITDARQIERLLEPGERVLDVGTGGGLPGVLIAILRPDLEVALSESVAKKARAVEAIVREAGLEIPVHHCRAEQVLEGQPFDTLVVRAVAPLWKLLTWFKPHWVHFKQLLVVKGPSWAEERTEARERRLLTGLNLRVADTYNIPSTDAQSVILRIAARD